jgi:hypothetical protein
MKKIINSAFVVALTTILFSCQKQKDFTLATSETAATQTTLNKPAPLQPVGVPFTLSEWFYVTLIPNRDGSLYGSYELKKPLYGAADTDIKLAYVRRKVQGTSTPTDGYSYSRLPADVVTSDGQLANMSFTLSTNLFEIFIRPVGIIPMLLDPDEFGDCTYRYIVISKADYDGLNVDWSDYKAVAGFLNFTP